MLTADSSRLSQLCASVMLASLALSCPAFADIGPKFGPNHRFVISFTFPGGTPEVGVQVALLALDLPDRQARLLRELRSDREMLPGLEARLAQEPDGSRWSYCSYTESIDLRSIKYRPQPLHGFPQTIRVAAYVPSRKQLFLTDPVETSRRDNTYLVHFDEDGTGTLRHASEISWMRENYVAEILEALAGTLLIELSFVFFWVRLTKQGSPRRVVLVALAGNLISVPAVWTAALLAKLYLDLDTYVLIYALGEVGAAVFEGALYAKLGRLTPWNAMALSLTANCASFLSGCCLVSYY